VVLTLSLDGGHSFPFASRFSDPTPASGSLSGPSLRRGCDTNGISHTEGEAGTRGAIAGSDSTSTTLTGGCRAPDLTARAA
jgi:hypothetical protein